LRGKGDVRKKSCQQNPNTVAQVEYDSSPEGKDIVRKKGNSGARATYAHQKKLPIREVPGLTPRARCRPSKKRKKKTSPGHHHLDYQPSAGWRKGESRTNRTNRKKEENQPSPSRQKGKRKVKAKNLYGNWGTGVLPPV